MSPSSRTIQLTDLNSVITCPLCSGYYVDATTLVDCMHSFCKSCILKHFENNKIVCPTCNTTCKRKENFSYYKSDMQLQTLVYKIVPGLYAKETQRREDFYRTAGVRASSSCSDDSVIGDNMQEHEEWINTIGDENQFLSPDDSISLSLEFYQQHLDVPSAPKTDVDSRNSEPDADGNNDDSAKSTSDKNETENADVDKKSVDGGEDKVQSDSYSDSISQAEKVRDRRYLQCPAAVQMIHLQKFIRCKYALSAEHKVDIIHNREVLPPNFTLMDVAYTFKWKRVKPMRFFYRIFTPMKIKPIRIINTSCTSQKQLQIVPVISNQSQDNKPPEPPPKISPPRTSPPPKETETTPATIFDSEENNKEKERLMAELQLQSKAKMLENLESPEKHQNARYGKTYERNHEVNHAFIGEKRKREADDKRRDGGPFEKKKRLEVEAGISTKIEKKVETAEEEAGCVSVYADTDQEELKRFAENRDREWQMIKHPDEEHRAYKKRKKSKHSKGEKRKMHAEITSELSNKQESIKLKVKLTPHNGHKHSKHMKNQSDDRNSLESRDKERLRQMRQVRHKSIGMDEKTVRTSEKKPKELETKSEFTITLAKTTTETQTRTTEIEMKTSETQTKSSETQTVSKEDKKDKTEGAFAGKTLRSDFTIKTATGKEILNKQAIVQTEKIDQIDKPVLKALPRIPYTKQDKIKSESTEKKIAQTTKSLQQQISLLCKTKEKQMEPPKLEKKVTFSSEKPRILNTQYLPGFTVSKIEAGAKKKPEAADPNQDKRPSLEITPINPPSNITTEATSNTTVSKPSSSTAAKRPLPPTIPLERIKSMKDIATLSGISIIPKMSEKCDNIGALDLSKPHKSTDTKIDLNKNGLNPNGNGLKPIPTVGDKGPLSNLQMLSKVATEHPNINKPLNVQNKPRQQIPALQNIKLPAGTVHNQPGNKSVNLAKIPKLNEINKGQFRMSNSPRTMRPNQNQSIRNIPNPSLLVRQQNQNRMNSLSVTPTSGEKEMKGNATTAPEGDNKKQEETKPVEKCDITVSKT